MVVPLITSSACAVVSLQRVVHVSPSDIIGQVIARNRTHVHVSLPVSRRFVSAEISVVQRTLLVLQSSWRSRFPLLIKTSYNTGGQYWPAYDTRCPPVKLQHTSCLCHFLYRCPPMRFLP